MRLLFVITGSVLNRGMATGLENLAWGLAGSGHDVFVLSGGKTPALLSANVPDKVTYCFTGNSGWAGEHKGAYRDLVKSSKFDFVVGWSTNLGPLREITSRKDRFPLFISNEGRLLRADPPLMSPEFFRSLLSSAVTRRTSLRSALAGKNSSNLRQMDFVVPISQSVAANLESVAGIESRLVKVIRRGVDTDFFAPSGELSRSPFADETEPVRIFFSGLISESKGVGLMLAALDFFSVPIELRLAGKDGGFLFRVQEKMCNRPKSSTWGLTYLGVLDRQSLLQELRSADLFLFPSTNEGLGKSPMEAMAVGLPTVVAPIPALMELIGTDDSGIVLPRLTAEQIAMTVEGLVEDREGALELGSNARLRTIANFSFKSELIEWEALLEKMFFAATRRVF